MAKQNNSNHLNGKDLMNVGIFTAVYLVIYIISSCVLGIIPLLSLTMNFFSSILLGIPVMLYFTKIKKFGMALITYAINGVLMAFLGLGIYSLILGVICGLIAELILRSGRYQSANCAVLAFSIACVGGNGNTLSWIIGGEKVLEQTAASLGTDYANAVGGYFSHWWVFPIIMLSAFAGGLIGGLLGKAVLKKHFIRSGLV